MNYEESNWLELIKQLKSDHKVYHNLFITLYMIYSDAPQQNEHDLYRDMVSLISLV